MKIKIIAFIALCVLIFEFSGPTADAQTADSKTAKAIDLVQLLPASDGVVTIDVKRFFATALPMALSGNQPILDSTLAQIDAFTKKTGIELRDFDAVAGGVSATKIKDTEYDLFPVIIARGKTPSSQLIESAKKAANSKFREEKAGATTIYLFETKGLVTEAAGNAPGNVSKLLNKLSGETAAAIIDDNTIVFGDPGNVRAAVEKKTSVSKELRTLISKRSSAVVGFAAKMPAGMRAFLPLDNDDLGKNIDSITHVHGSLDVSSTAAMINIAARTQQNSQAKALLETIESLQFVGQALLGGAPGEDKKLYAKLLENAKFTAKNNEVIFDLSVEKADLNFLSKLLK